MIASDKHQNFNSIKNLLKLLDSIRASPSSFKHDKELTKALKSQSGLAKYTSSGGEIEGSSLNTQKRRAEAALDGGYFLLDIARKAALDALVAEQNTKLPQSLNSKAALQDRNQALREELELLKGDLEILSDMLQKSMHQARDYAEAAGQLTRERCKKEQREIMNLMGLRSKPRLKAIS